MEALPSHVSSTVAAGSLSLDDSPLASSPTDRVHVTLRRAALGDAGARTQRCLHCGAAAARFSFSEVLRTGARAVGVVRAAGIALLFGLAGLLLVHEQANLDDAKDYLELSAVVFSAWAIAGLVAGSVLLSAHAVFARRFRLKLSLCGACEQSAQRATSLRALLEVGAILGSALTLVGLALYLAAPAPCACEDSNPDLLFLVFAPGLLLPAAALGRLALWWLRRDRDVRLVAVDAHDAHVVAPRPMAALLRRERPDLLR